MHVLAATVDTRTPLRSRVIYEPAATGEFGTPTPPVASGSSPVRNDQGERGVADKVIELMEAVGTAQRGLTISELARSADVPVSTAHRLVQRLCRRGWLERDSQRRYFVGLRLWEVSAAAPSVSLLRERARPFLERLQDVAHHTATLSVFQEDRVITLDRVTARRSRPRGEDPVIGERLPLHASAAGLVLLAHAEGETRERALTRKLVRYTDKTVTDLPTLRRLIAEVRSRGHATVRDAWRPVTEVAAPVQAGRHSVGSVSLVLPLEDMEVNQYVMALDATARSISAALAARA